MIMAMLGFMLLLGMIGGAFLIVHGPFLLGFPLMLLSGVGWFGLNIYLED